MCQGYAALLLTGKFLLQCLSAAVYLQICSAVEVQSSPLNKDLKDFLQTLQDVLKYLSKTELRVFGYSSLFVESLMVFGKTFYWREAVKEGADVEPLKNDINSAGSLFGQGEHLVTFYSVFSVKNWTFPSGIWVKICVCNAWGFDFGV